MTRSGRCASRLRGCLRRFPSVSCRASSWQFIKKAADEYVLSQTANAERPEAMINLGNYYAERGDIDKAEAVYKKAIDLAEHADDKAIIELVQKHENEKKVFGIF